MFYVNEQFGLLLVACSLSIAGVFLTFLFKLLQRIPIIEKDVTMLREELSVFNSQVNRLKIDTITRDDFLDDKIEDLGGVLRTEISNNSEKYDQRLNQIRLELKGDIKDVSGKIDEANRGIIEILKLISKKD